MRIVRELPEAVRVVRHVWIPMRDGVRLSARLWLPESSERTPAPAILEYIPYRKDDHSLPGDEPRHRYWAGHGYASVRVDLRGSGDSEGILMDEYLPQEQDDAEDVLAWLAEQPWCTGRVGMIGISWGGFNGLQVAARRPPQLGCVVSLCSTDDRYADDVHYMGGTLLGIDMLAWASTMLAYNSRPPDPEIVGEDRWRDMWLQRLHETPPWIESWVTHQRRDAFWKQGSVCDDYDALQVPVYMVGGWNDAYTNAIPRFLEGYRGPRKGLIGPWSHNYPEVGTPGPAIGFLQETLRWFDHWLRDRATGIMDEPQLRVWMQEWAAPSPRHAHRDGRWVTEPSWPSPGDPDRDAGDRLPRSRSPRWRRRGASLRHPLRPRGGRRQLVPVRLDGRRAAGPARGGRALAVHRLRPPGRAPRAAGQARGRARADGRCAARARRRAALRRRTRRLVPAARARLPQPHAPLLARASRARPGRRADDRARRARRGRPGDPRRAPAAALARDRVLAVDLAVARARGAHVAHGR